MTLHPDAQRVVDVYLEAADAEATGVVDGLYLTGSIALGDFRPGTSDIDFLAVTAHPPRDAEVRVLERAHNRLRDRCPRPFFDGRYVTWDELSRDPRRAAPGPYAYQGRFHAKGAGDCNPVTWHTVASHGVCCRGSEPAATAIWTDVPALKEWTLKNYDDYWQPLLRRTRRFPDPWSLTAFTSYGAVWIVLGVCRLHYTLATGNIGSKATAGAYGLDTFPPEWHLVLNEALRIREADRARADAMSALSETLHDLGIRNHSDNRSLYESPVARRRDVLAFADMVIADAQVRFRR